MLIRYRRLLFLLFFPFLGCGDSHQTTTYVPTDKLQPNITVRAEGTGSSDIQVYFCDESRELTTLIFLDSGDTLTASDGTDTHALTINNPSGFPIYETSFATDAEDTEFSISLNRSAGVNAEHTVVSLPAPFDFFVSPLIVTGDGDSTLTLTWTSAFKDDILLVWSGATCSETVNGEPVDSYYLKSYVLEDDGEAEFALESFIDAPDLTVFDQGCDIELELVRMRTGHLDSAYGEGSYIDAKQSRTSWLQYIP